MQAMLVVGGEGDALLSCEGEDRGNPQATVEVVMQFDLWDLMDDFLGYHALIIAHVSCGAQTFV